MKRVYKPETYYAEKLRLAISELGGVALKFDSRQNTGWPDRFMMVPPGLFFLAETKAESKKVQPGSKQDRRINKARKLGFTVFVINSMETLKQAIDAIQTARLSKALD